MVFIETGLRNLLSWTWQVKWHFVAHYSRLQPTQYTMSMSMTVYCDTDSDTDSDSDTDTSDSILTNLS